MLLWIGGEVTGFIVGFGADMGNGAYVLALAGAAIGALIAWGVASAVKPLHTLGAHQVGNVFD